MKKLKKPEKSEVYDTAINIIGSLRDCDMIYKAFDAYFNPIDSCNNLLEKQNIFNLRTERSRTRVEREVNKMFLQFVNDEHESLIQGIFAERVPQKDKELALVWQFALNNRLFREITTNVFVKIYYSGRTSISKDDIIAYLKELLKQNELGNIRWSEITINTLSTKYLNLMSKFGFLSTGRTKTFINFRPSIESQVLFQYFAKLFSPNSSDILANEFLSISFIPLTDIQEWLKKLSMKGLINMNYNGLNLNTELKYSYKGICDELYG